MMNVLSVLIVMNGNLLSLENKHGCPLLFYKIKVMLNFMIGNDFLRLLAYFSRNEYA